MVAMSYRIDNDYKKFIYILPPVKYPNGKYYIKIGHPVAAEMAKDKKSLQNWFHSEGNKKEISSLKQILASLMPDIKFKNTHSNACVITTSPNGNNYIDAFADKDFYAVLPGESHSAKSSDALGKIMSTFATEGKFPKNYDADKFKLIYE